MSDGKLAGLAPPKLQALPQISDRLAFVYLERCVITRADGAISAIDKDGVIHIPTAGICALLLGPGVDISHRAVQHIGNCGVSLVWVGEKGVRFYAHGRSLAKSSALLVRQAKLVSNQRSHLDVVRSMYSMRFSGEDVSQLTTQQLRGREGSRIRSLYRKLASEYGIEWHGRLYDPDDFSSGNEVNRALSAGNACLYGLAHAVIVALGCSPGLGFVHVNHSLSFVYDIADLYKADITIPIAFELASQHPDNLESEVRHRVRDAMTEARILEKMVRDIRILLHYEEDDDDQTIALWDGPEGTVESGVSYGDWTEFKDVY